MSYKKNVMVILVKDWIQNWTQYHRELRNLISNKTSRPKLSEQNIIFYQSTTYPLCQEALQANFVISESQWDQHNQKFHLVNIQSCSLIRQISGASWGFLFPDKSKDKILMISAKAHVNRGQTQHRIKNKEKEYMEKSYLWSYLKLSFFH